MSFSREKMNISHEMMADPCEIAVFSIEIGAFLRENAGESFSFPPDSGETAAVSVKKCLVLFEVRADLSEIPKQKLRSDMFERKKMARRTLVLLAEMKDRFPNGI